MNLGIKFLTNSVYFTLIFFFGVLLAYYFYSREGMNVKLIYHPLQNTKGMIQFYNFDDSDDARANLPNILNAAAPLSQTNFDATLFSNNSVDTMIVPNAKIGNACLKLDMTQKQFVKLPQFIIPQKPDVQISANRGMTFALFFNILDVYSQGIMTLFDYSNDKYRICAYYNTSTKCLECISSFGTLTQTLKSTTIQPSQWYHFAWTLSPDNINPKKDGQSILYLDFIKNTEFAYTNQKGFVYPASEFLNNGTPVTLTNNAIGKCTKPIVNDVTYSVDASYFNGYIDNYIVYNSAYTSSNIATLSNLYSSNSSSYTVNTA